MRMCPQCGTTLEPFFDSTCEDPVAWLCQTCRTVQMDVDGDTLTPDARRELVEREAFMRAAGQKRTADVARARERARTIFQGVRQIPVDIARIAEQHGYPVRERSLPGGERGTITREGDHTVIVISRDRLGRAEAERRWVIAEELGHALLEHSTLVASSRPAGAPAIAEPRRRVEEREAKAFAAEVLMPEEKIRERFAELAPRIYRAVGLRHRQAETDQVVTALARMFGVTPSAMRLRLEEFEVLR